MKKRHTFLLLPLFLLFFLQSNVFSQSADRQNQKKDSISALFEMSMEELLNLKIAIASKNEKTIRESPGIISIITENEIKKSGARDMIDILRLVPGFEFGLDVQGITDATLRGNWVHEGKILLLIDGQELNELSYSTLQLGNHYDVSQIKRIEIIRGPGSAIYGGFAELGVINIITKQGGDLKGITAEGTYSQMGDVYGQRNLSVAAGNAWDDFSFSVHGFIGQGMRSDKDYTDIFGATYNMANQSEINPHFFNAGMKYKNLELRFIFDNYRTTSRDIYGENLLKDYTVDYISTLGELKYKWKVNDKFTIIPKFNFKRTKPYHGFEEPLEGESSIYLDAIYIDRDVTRLTGELGFNYQVNENLNILGGTEYYHDVAQENLDDPERTYWNGEKNIDYSNIGAYLQASIDSRIANLTFGSRVDKHSQFGASFAPRLALTKVLGKSHFKLLFSQAYRSPGIENIDLNAGLNPPEYEPDIMAEKTNVVEFETGRRLTKTMFLSANLFYIKIKDPIVYYFDEQGNEGYDNMEQTGSYGFEVQYQWKTNNGYLAANYSHYLTNENLNKTNDYIVHNDKSALLGSPKHKLNVYGSYNFTKKLSINPSVTYLSSRYAYTDYDAANDDVVQEEIPAKMLANINLRYESLFVDGLNVSVAVYNLLNADYSFIQPYNGWHSPLPGPSREFLFRLSYSWGK